MPDLTSSLLSNWKCLAACTLVSMSPFQYGIDFGAIGGLQAMRGFLEIFGHPDPTVPTGYNISTERQQLISSLMTLGAFLSSSFAGVFATRLGRRQCLWMASVLCCVANIVMMTTTSMGGIQESAPARYRGLMISVFQIWTSIGTLIGTVIDNATHDMQGRNSYIIPLGTIFIVPFFMSIGMFFIPESPRWLILVDRPAQAEKALLWMRPHPESVPGEVAEIQAAIDAEKAVKSSANFLDIWKDPVDRRRTLLAIAAVSTQAASGAMFMIAYGTYFFQMANVGSPFMNSCILTSVGVLAIMVIVGLSVVYIIGYNGMIAAYAWLTGGEIPSQRLRSYTFGIASAVGFAGAWLATFTAPYFINPESLNWGPEYGWIWGPSCFITVIWVYFYLPEIKNRTLEEIDEMFEARLPARKFRKYVCTGRVLAGDGDEKLGSERRDSEKEGSEKDQVVHREVVDVGEKGA
ncbi:unnamed protein product [Alternaria alternata]